MQNYLITWINNKDGKIYSDHCIVFEWRDLLEFLQGIKNMRYLVSIVQIFPEPFK